MVKEFLDVFINKITGLPLEREVKVFIDVLPDTSLITQSLYQMTLTELAKQKIQQQKLLDKGYINLCNSPQIALVLFMKKMDGTL